MSSVRQKLAIVIIVCATASLTSGVSGFTIVTADRSTSVETADQTDAYLSFPKKLNCENDIITNEFPSKLNDGTVTVTPQGGNLTFGFHGKMKREFKDGEENIFEINETNEIESGESLTIQIDSKITNKATEVKVDVDTSGPTVAVETSTTVDIHCD